MPAMEPLYKMIANDLPSLKTYEILLLDADLFVQICEQLKKIINASHMEYFKLINFDYKMEHHMLETSLIPYVINDILSSEQYSLTGIAYYTDSPEDVIYEIAVGNNTNPSLNLSRKLLELHRSVRPELYRYLIRKIASNI